jgi:hypothetical protein
VIWSERSIHSDWVRAEVAQARQQGKLVEVALRPASVENALQVSDPIHTDPAHEELLARMAKVGHLPRPRDKWNASLTLTTFENRPPSDPIIALEWVPARPGEQSPWIRDIEGRPYRLVRRERWSDGATIRLDTAAGNFWLFGHEEACLGRGYLYTGEGDQTVTLPERDRKAERKAKHSSPFVIPFSYQGRLVEGMKEFSYPAAPRLEPRHVRG